MDKPTLKGESLHEVVHLPFGNISVKTNQYGSYEINISIEETHIVKYYKMLQRKNNTLKHLQIIIKPDDI